MPRDAEAEAAVSSDDTIDNSALLVALRRYLFPFRVY
jgi:hypothetical protein